MSAVNNDGAVATSMAGMLREHASRRPYAPAVSTSESRISYGELATSVGKLASALRRSGVAPGDRVAVVARNGLPYIQLMYAASWAGAALVCVNWRLTSDEMEEILNDSSARLVFAEPGFAARIDEMRADREIVLIEGEDSLEAWAAEGDAAEASRWPDPDSESVVLQLYTTGTTGRPKGVMLVERNVNAMVRAVSPRWLLHADMRFLAALPLFHVSGITSVVDTVYVGGEVVVPAGTSVDEVGEAIQQHRVTHTVLVPTILTSLVKDPSTANYNLESLEVLIYGSAPSGSSLIQDAMAMLPRTAFSQGYGLTEMCAGVAVAPLLRHGDADDKPGSVGTMNDNCELRIVDAATGQDLPVGDDGEIWVRSPQMTIGYWNRPEETAQAITADGWFRTGDIGVVDEDGYLYIRDRLKDMIISGGENIYSVEVENAISSHPDVLETAVYGVPHDHWGETVKAVVVTREGCELTADDVKNHLATRLASYKRPRIIEFVAELPKTGSGKILKRALRDQERA